MVRLVWNFESPAPPGPTWDVFSDTERLMASSGVVHSYYDEPRPDGGVRRIGRAQSGGKRVEWIEPPFDFVRGEWLRSERNFLAGPASQLVLLLRLKVDRSGGTQVRFAVEITPRTALMKPVIELGMARDVHKKLDAGISRLLERLQDPELGFGPACAVLSEARLERIATLCGRHSSPEFGELLAALLSTGSSAELLKITPATLAPRWAMDATDCLQHAVEAVELGLLGMQWELLCPFCRGGQQGDGDIRRVHCPACNIYFDGTFPDALEVSFRPADTIRDVPPAPSCPGSPVWRPTTVLQQRLQPGADRVHTLDLEAGVLRARTWPMRGAATLEVLEGGPREVVLEVRSTGISPLRQTVGTGLVQVILRSAEKRTVDMAIERRTTSSEILTAGRLREVVGSPAMRALLGAKGAQRRGLVALERLGLSREPLGAHLRDLAHRVVQAEEHRLLVSFDDVDSALGAAIALSASRELSVAVGAGVVSELDGALVGDALNALVEAAPFGWEDHPAVPMALAQDLELRRALESRGLRLRETRASTAVVRIDSAFG